MTDVSARRDGETDRHGGEAAHHGGEAAPQGGEAAPHGGEADRRDDGAAVPERRAELRARNAAFWAAAAPGWIRQADRHDRIAAPLGAAALAALAPRPGERALDVGCGCGGTTAELAAACGTAVGVDLSPAMVAAAAARFPHLTFAAADIETTDPPGGPYDLVFSRMCLMLLADPVAASRRLHAALAPGGRLAATVFRDGAANPWLFATVLGAAPHVGALPPLPVGDEPGPFAFADPARITRVLTAAGFTGVAVAPRDVVLDCGPDPDEVTAWLIEQGPAGAPYAAAPPDRRAAGRAGVAKLIARFRGPDGGYRLPAGIWLITADRDGPMDRKFGRRTDS
jgi:SAM-dependent methyltransferase